MCKGKYLNKYISSNKESMYHVNCIFVYTSQLTAVININIDSVVDRGPFGHLCPYFMHLLKKNYQQC